MFMRCLVHALVAAEAAPARFARPCSTVGDRPVFHDRHAAIRVGFILLALAIMPGWRSAQAAEGFQVVPAAVKLEGNFAQAQLVVTALDKDGLDKDGKPSDRSADLTSSVKYQSSNAKIVSASDTGRLLAHANGRATITVSGSAGVRKVEVEVTGVLPKPQVNFTEQVMPILSKAGCNAAACHASQHGKGGFKLSVFGYAPDEDYQAIARDREGRRVNLMDPDESLVLLKPTLTVPHGGNRRISYGSVGYDILYAWACRPEAAAGPAEN